MTRRRTAVSAARPSTHCRQRTAVNAPPPTPRPPPAIAPVPRETVRGHFRGGNVVNRLRIVAVVAAAAAGLAGAVLVPGQAQAAGSVHLYKIYYNSPGTDHGSNASLNAEYVQIRNSTSKAASLKGWTLTDAQNHTYTFGTYTLAAGKTVTVHTGKGSNTAYNRYQNRAAYVWNNTSDKATLRKSSGATVDTCSYNSSTHAYKMC
jgi:hypothetical protein